MSRVYSLLVIALALIALDFIAVRCAYAQTATASVVLKYTMPTVNTDGTTIPATGPNSLAKVQVWLSLTPWATDVDVSGPPTSEAAPGTTSTSQFAASVGDTVYARVKVCNLAGNCGPTSNQASGVVKAATPGSATMNTVEITLK